MGSQPSLVGLASGWSVAVDVVVVDNQGASHVIGGFRLFINGVGSMFGCDVDAYQHTRPAYQHTPPHMSM